MKTNALITAALILQPFLMAAGTIAMKGMNKMPEQTCTTYMLMSVTILSGIYLFSIGDHFEFINQFDL